MQGWLCHLPERAPQAHWLLGFHVAHPACSLGSVSALLPQRFPLRLTLQNSQGWLFTPCQCLWNALNPSQLVPNQTLFHCPSNQVFRGLLALCGFLGAPCDPELFPWFLPHLLWFICSLLEIGSQAKLLLKTTPVIPYCLLIKVC